jgi:hypothetical protein
MNNSALKPKKVPQNMMSQRRQAVRVWSAT